MVVGNAERDVVSWCTKPGHGSRLIPKGALTGVHMLRTPHYIQITGTQDVISFAGSEFLRGSILAGTGDFTKMNIPGGDDGYNVLREWERADADVIPLVAENSTPTEQMASVRRTMLSSFGRILAEGAVTGNPIGGIVIANHNKANIQIKEWNQFISDREFCIRACLPGKDAARYCVRPFF